MQFSEENKELDHAQGGASFATPLQLEAPDITGKNGPVPSGEWGINIAAAQELFPRHGLQLFISPWSDMNRGDSVAVLLGDEQVAHKAIDTLDLDVRQTLFIPVNRMIDGDISTISYVLTRLGQAAEKSAAVDVLFKLNRPGGKDPDGDVPGHPALRQSIPQDIIENGVDKKTAENGVPVTIEPYPNRAEHDLIRLTWGGVFIETRLTEDDVKDESKPVVVMVDKETIFAAGDSDSSGLAVAYEVYDLVSNKSEDWSREIRVVVDTGDTLLSAGILKEAVDNVLDLEQLGGAPGTLEVTAAGSNFEHGDIILASLTGATAEGVPVSYEYDGVEINNLPHVYEIPVANGHLRSLAKAQGVFRYKLKKKDGSESKAKGQFVSIIGSPVQLAKPEALDAHQGTLDPELRLTTIAVPWDETMEAGQTVDLKWYGIKPDQTPYFPEIPLRDITGNDVKEKKPLLFYVDGKHLAAINGGTLQLYYELIDIEGFPRGSVKTEFFAVGEPRQELPAPSVKGETGGYLDPDALQADGSAIVVKSYNDIALRDELVFYWTGSETGEYSDSITITRANIDRKEFSLPIALERVKRDLDGTVTAAYKVNRAEGRTSFSDPLTFKVGEVQAELLEPVTVEKNNDGSLDLNDVREGAAGYLAVYPQMAEGDVVFLEWTDGYDNAYKPKGQKVEGPMVGQDVPFLVPYAEVQKSLDSTVTVICRVQTLSGDLRTRDLTFSVVQSQAPELDPVTVEGVEDGVLDLRKVREGTQVTLAAYDAMGAGDKIFLEWTDNAGNTYKPDGKAVSGGMVGKPVNFLVPYTEIEKSQGSAVTVICRIQLVDGDDDGPRTKDFTFAVVEGAAPPLLAPSVAEANDQGVIDPNKVTRGATVVIDAAAALVAGDAVRVVLSGKADDERTHTVTASGEQRFPLAYEVIKANENGSIELQYFVKRGGTGPEEESPPAAYDVRVVAGGGQLKILGARFTRSTYRSSGAPRYVHAYHAVSGQPLQAEWKYATDEQWTVASSWRDIQPHLPLQVRTSDDQVTLNPANILGNGADTTLTGTAAFIAHRDDGRVRGWGNAAFGATVDPTIRTLNDIVEVSCTGSAYAIRRVGGVVMAWGNATNGGSMGGVAPDGFNSVIANSVAFAGLKANNRVVAWGVAASGGTVPEAIGSLTDIEKVVGAGTAFAALRKTGGVVAWGAATAGGTVPEAIKNLQDITDIKGNFKAFAALRRNGSVVAWGDAAYGGDADAIADETNIKEICSANAGAFVVKLENGRIKAWGSAAHGGTLPSPIDQLNDIVDVASNWHAFAAVRANGSVVGWGGTADEGGVVPDEISDLTDAVQVTGSSKAFAVLRRNGTVMAWGNKTVGGDITPVASDLVNIQAVYSNTHGFVALRADGRVFAWGQAQGGGDLSAVRGQLDGFVFYRSTPAARGRSLSAQRVISAASVVG